MSGSGRSVPNGRTIGYANGSANGGDLLAPAGNDRLVSVAYVASELRRRRWTLVALALIGLIIGTVLGVGLPVTHSANTIVLLQFPSGSDSARAMSTDLSLLTTRSVAHAAGKSLGIKGSPDALLAKYRGAILSDGVLQITADGGNAATAERRARAVTTAFLRFRKTVYDQQLAVALAALDSQETSLRDQVVDLTGKINQFDASRAAPGTPLESLVGERASINAQIQSIEATKQADSSATAAVVKGSRVIDPANVDQRSLMKAAVINAASGLVAGLAIGVGAVTLFAVASGRVRRRSDIATALRAPVTISVGRVAPPRWRRALWRPQRQLKHPSGDLDLVVRHLRTALAAAPEPALVIVAVDDLPVATLAVQLLRSQIAAEGRAVAILNETGGRLAGGRAGVEADRRGAERNPAAPRESLLVLAVLDPMKGADHLREWASDAVAIVTAGRSTPTKLHATATLIRSAGLRLRSAVLIGSDRSDDSLGVFETRFAPAGFRPVVRDDPISAVRSS